MLRFGFQRRITPPPHFVERLITMSSSASIQPRNFPAWLTPTLFILGLLAALVAEPVVSANRERFFTATGLPPFPPALMWKVFWDNVYNHAICYGFLGIVTCGLVGLAAGATIRPMRAILGAVVGSVVGLFAGVTLGVSGWYLSERVLESSYMDSIYKAILIFVPFWFGLTLAACFVALLVTNKLNHFASTVFPSLAFVIAAVVVYIGVVTALFPSDWPGRIIPEFGRVRLVLEITGCLGLAGAVLAVMRASSRVEKKIESATI